MIMNSIVINNLKFLIKSNISILEACKFLGINIPKFCYHESLSVAGNCRMCLVELQKTPKPVASCAMPVVNNMVIYTTTPLVKKARENVLEALLINHPLDCPICDQGGECDLQDETKLFGLDFNRFYLNRRSVEDKECGLIIKTIMTRCIHCTRCVRFCTEIAGVDFFGTVNRGTHTEISNYVTASFNSYISGNVIDLCPVGALTSKNYAFKARPWELKSIETIDLTDGSGSLIYYNYKESDIVRVLPKVNKEINENWISDRIRFSFDSFNNSRIHSIFYKKNKISFKKTNWLYIFNKILNILKKKTKVIFFINNELDLNSLIYLKKIVYFSQNKIQLVNINKTEKNYNFYITWLTNKITDIKNTKNCFIFFVNLQLENIAINTKLKKKLNQQNLNIINFGNTFNSTFPLCFSNISPQSFITFLESKIKDVAKILIKKELPLIIFGETVTKTLVNNQYLNYFFRKIIINSIILNVSTKCNTESLTLLNIKSNSTKNIKTSKNVVSLNLDDTFYLRKIINNKLDNFWFNSYGSSLAAHHKYVLPSLNNVENTGIFLNLEQRPQKTQPLFFKINESKSLENFLSILIKNFVKKNFTILKYNCFNFLNEFVDNPVLFKSINIKLSKTLQLVVNKSTNFVFFRLPRKFVIEDFFLVNTFCKNSLFLNSLSVNNRKNTVQI